MDKLKQLHKRDNSIMFYTKATEISYSICRLGLKGDLSIKLRKGQDPDQYQLLLDSSPVEEELQKELMPYVLELL